MAQVFQKNSRNCAVCNLWGGTRDINTSGYQVTVDSYNTEGKCLHPTAGWKGRSMRAHQYCNDWEAWGALR